MSNELWRTSDAGVLMLTPSGMRALEKNIELTDSYERLITKVDAAHKALAQAESIIDALAAENERLRKDAERYRWLRTRINWVDSDYGVSTARTAPIVSIKVRNWTHCDVRCAEDRPTIESIDEYIDAALAKEPTT